MISKNSGNIIDLIVVKIQEVIDIGTDVYCYDYLVQNNFDFQNTSIDFFAYDIDLIQS
jgi:hypothetical protein